MLDRALLALTDERRTRQDYGQEGDLVDDLRHCREPRRLQVRVERGANDEVDRVCPLTSVLANEVLHLVGDSTLEIVGPVAGLSYRRRIDINLNLRLALGENMSLEVRRDLDDQHQLA